MSLLYRTNSPVETTTGFSGFRYFTRAPDSDEWRPSGEDCRELAWGRYTTAVYPCGEEPTVETVPQYPSSVILALGVEFNVFTEVEPPAPIGNVAAVRLELGALDIQDKPGVSFNALRVHGQVDGGCGLPSASAVSAPEFRDELSGVDNDDVLRMLWLAPRLTESARYAFRDDESGACSMASAVALGQQPSGSDWTYGLSTAFNCTDEWAFERDLESALEDCGFVEDGSTSSYTEYRSTVAAQYTLTGGSAVDRLYRVAVRFPTPVLVRSADTPEAGPSVDASAVSGTANSLGSRQMSWQVLANVLSPYYLVEGEVTTDPPSFTSSALAVVEGSGGNCGGVTGTCPQRFTVSGTRGEDECTVATDVNVAFTLACRSSVSGCSVPLDPASFVSFRLEVPSQCTEVAVAAPIVPSLAVYESSSAAAEGTTASSFAIDTLLYARCEVEVEAGAAVSLVSVRVNSVVIVSGTSRVTAVQDGETRVSSISIGFTSGGASKPYVDLSFVLNENVVRFDSLDESGGMSLEVTVSVGYSPGEPGVMLTTATTGFVMSSTSGGPGSGGGGSSGDVESSTSSGESTIFGVSTPTAALSLLGVMMVFGALGGGYLIMKRRNARAELLQRRNNVLSRRALAAKRAAAAGGGGAAAATASSSSSNLELQQMRASMADRQLQEHIMRQQEEKAAERAPGAPRRARGPPGSAY